jgi:HEAT repeat protein
MAELAPPGPKLLPALLEGLASEERDVAWEAARLLVDAGRLHAEVAPILAGLVRAGETAAQRRMAVTCLQKLAPEDPETAKALIEASRDGDVALRRAAVTALSGLVEPGAGVRTRLDEAATRDPDPAVRRLAERGGELLAREERR